MASSSSEQNKEGGLVKLQENASVVKVVLVVAICILNAASNGMTAGYATTGAVMYTTQNATSLVEPMDENQISWFMSVYQIPNVTLCLLSGFINDFLGRKKSMLLGQLICLLGWIGSYFAHTYTYLILGRCVVGAGIGVLVSTTTIYLSEISLIRFRGMLSMMNILNSALFVAVSLVCAAIVPFNTLIMIEAVPCCLFLIFATIFLPESPIWYTKKNRIEDARKSLEWLRGSNYDVQEELNEMENILAHKQDWKESMKEMSQRNFLLPILMMLVIMTIQPYCGITMLAVYSLDLFKRTEVQYNHYVLSIMTTSLCTTGYLISTYLTKKVPRKVHFMTSGLVLALNLFIAGMIIKLKETSPEDATIHWLSQNVFPICIVLSGLCYGLGVGPVPFALLGEVLPQKIKAVASSSILTLRYTSIFMNLKFFPECATSFGVPMVLWFYCSTCLLISLIAYFIMPETRGKTLTELSILFEKKPKEGNKILT